LVFTIFYFLYNKQKHNDKDTNTNYFHFTFSLWANDELTIVRIARVEPHYAYKRYAYKKEGVSFCFFS